MANTILASAIPTTLQGLLTVFALSIVLHQLSCTIYNLFFHPLRRFPGPRMSAASVYPIIQALLNGAWLAWVTDLHSKYGEVVRISPNELSFSSADAYKDVYGHGSKAGNSRTLEKDPRFYKVLPGELVTNIPTANTEDHSRMRRIFSNAFSDRALKLQEPLFLAYVDKLINKLRQGCQQEPGRKFDMVQLFNFTTFDIMGDLIFGESLDMLADDSYHPWVATIFSNFQVGVYVQAIRYFPRVENFMIKYCIPDMVRKQMAAHRAFSVARVDRRLERDDARPDIWGLVLKQHEASGLSRDEMYSNADVFMIAGTETTATLLSGLTWYLLQNPDTLRKLTTEVRTTFEREEDITIEKLQSMKYLYACLEEGLRMYPPVAIGMRRVTPAGAPTYIDGYKVPPRMSVMVTNMAAYRNPNNFRNPNAFVPERWLSGSSVYAGDKKHGLQPFSIGPRGCLGKNMAYHEMRIILTVILFNFDLELCEESKQWIDQKVFIMWAKGPLFVRLKPRVV